jgi:hypothetical protein
MSSSSEVVRHNASTETLNNLAMQLNADLVSILSDGNLASIREDTIQSLLSPLVKLYTAIVEETGTELTPTSSEISPTEAVTLACSLLRAQGLNPFDLAIWFSRGKKTRIAQPTS